MDRYHSRIGALGAAERQWAPSCDAQSTKCPSSERSAPDCHGTVVHVTPIKSMEPGVHDKSESHSGPSVEPADDLGWLEQVMGYIGCAAPRTKLVHAWPRNDLLDCTLCARSEAMGGWWGPKTEAWWGQEVVANTVADTDGGKEASSADARTVVLAHRTKPPTPKAKAVRQLNWDSPISVVPTPLAAASEELCPPTVLRLTFAPCVHTPAPASAVLTPLAAACEESKPSVSEPSGGNFGLRGGLHGDDSAPQTLGTYPRSLSECSLLSYCTGDSEVELIEEEVSSSSPPPRLHRLIAPPPPARVNPPQNRIATTAPTPAAQQLGADSHEGGTPPAAPSCRIRRQSTWRRQRPQSCPPRVRSYENLDDLDDVDGGREKPQGRPQSTTTQFAKVRTAVKKMSFRKDSGPHAPSRHGSPPVMGIPVRHGSPSTTHHEVSFAGGVPLWRGGAMMQDGLMTSWEGGSR